MKKLIEDISLMPNKPGETNDIDIREKESNKLMRDTILELKRIIREEKFDGLTACQIGVNERIMVINYGDDNLQTYINPMMTKAEGMVFNRETCIYLPNKQYLVPRYKKITLVYETPLGQIKQANFIGKSAYVVQHLMWHMDGMFIDEVGLEIDDDWDNLTDEEKTIIFKQYAESLDIAQAELNDELEKSEEGRKFKDAVEFEKAVMSGEVQIKEEELRVINRPEKKENTDEDTSIQEGNN